MVRDKVLTAFVTVSMVMGLCPSYAWAKDGEGISEESPVVLEEVIDDEDSEGDSIDLSADDYSDVDDSTELNSPDAIEDVTDSDADELLEGAQVQDEEDQLDPITEEESLQEESLQEESLQEESSPVAIEEVDVDGIEEIEVENDTDDTEIEEATEGENRLSLSAQGAGDDTKGAATSIKTNKWISNSTIKGGDEDWYRFTLPKAGYVSLSWSNDYEDGNGRWIAHLYGVDTDEISNWVFRADAEKARKTEKVKLPAGTYYIMVREYWTTTTAQYNFKINASKVSIAKATVSTIKSKRYTGKAIKPKPTVKLGGKKLVRGIDYTLSYTNNVQRGTATVTVKGKGSYKGSVSKTFKIVKGSIAKAKVTKIGTKRYTGQPIHPKLTVKAAGSGKVLTEGNSYELTYKNTSKVGTATITITGKGNFTGTKKVTFKIAKGRIAKARVSGIKASYSRTGKAITPKPVVRAAGSGKVLTEGSSYTLSYANNKERGTATVTITGKGNFTGTKKVTFKIV